MLNCPDQSEKGVFQGKKEKSMTKSKQKFYTRIEFQTEKLRSGKIIFTYMKNAQQKHNGQENTGHWIEFIKQKNVKGIEIVNNCRAGNFNGKKAKL